MITRDQWQEERRRITVDEYAKIDAVNWSTLKHMAKSPLHYRHACDNPSEDTTGRLKGRGNHTAVLEPERFLVDYALYKGKTRRGKDWEAFKAVHSEDSILKLPEYNQCLRIAEKVRKHPAVAPILARAKREQVITWTDEETGLRCKGRVDLLDDESITDLKGVTSTDPRRLAVEVAKMAYHCQLAFYREGLRVITGKNLSGKLICAEHCAPHDVVVLDVGDDGLYAGWEYVRGLLHRVAECKKTGRWPGRSDDVINLELPSWVFPDDEQSMEVEVINA